MNKKDTITTVSQFIKHIRAMFDSKERAKTAFLKAQVQTLLEFIGERRILLTDEQRARLAKTGVEAKDSLNEASLIFEPETILKWNRALKAKKWDFSRRRKSSVGRPATATETEAIIVKLARENTWGYDRIVGELAKLGHTVSPTTVRNILKKNGLPTSPNRKGMDWKTFIKSHLDTTWATDFRLRPPEQWADRGEGGFTDEVWTMGGLVTFYVLFFIHHQTRRIHIAGCTPNPNTQWVTQQARNFLITVDPENIKYLVHDNDASFQPMDKVFKATGVEIVKIPPQSPNCNSLAERFVREARETLDNFVLIGQPHLERVVKNIENYHNSYRPHQGLENKIPLGYEYPVTPAPPKKIKRQAFLGGLTALSDVEGLNHYHVDKAA